MKRCVQLTCIAVAAMLAVNVQAAEIFWVGGTGNFTDPNYSDGVSTTLVPQELDLIFLGNSGIVTHSVSGIAVHQKLRIGHDMVAPGGVGAATLTVNNGAQLNLLSAGSGANASLVIGGGAVATTNSGFSGTLNIDGTGSSVTSAQLVQIGFGSQSTANATVNITNGGSLTNTSGDINLGNRNGATGVGVPGHLNISGETSAITVNGAALNVGVRAASSYSQTDGTVSIGLGITVGQNGAQNSTLSLTGGTLTAGGSTGGTVTVGDDNAHGSSLTVSGGTFNARTINIGPNANNVSASITGNAVVNVSSNGFHFNVGTGDAQGTSLLVADNADINILNTVASTGNMFIGKDTSTNTTFTMTGGTIDTGRNFLMGNATGATGIVGNQSGGKITTTLNFVVADTNGGSVYNLSGGEIVANGQVVVGRQTTAANSGVMNQTGGIVTAALGITVGNAQDANTALWGTGIYNVSNGTVTANQTTGTALTIGTQGAGTFRVIGDDAVIDINGNATVNAGGGAQGTLAYRLEADDLLLSMIDVSGTATFNAGALLAFDTSLTTPTQTSYNLLTATDVIDNGLVFSGPAGWSFDIIAGGNGEILRAVQTGPVGVAGDYNGNGTVDAADYVLWRKGGPLQNEIATPGSVTQEDYDSWRARFGNTTGSGAGTGLNAGQVPEPASAALVLAAVLTLAGFRRR